MKEFILKGLLLTITLFTIGCRGSSDEPSRAVIVSGRVNTNGKFSFQYGTIEARIKPPQTANGLWPAFWLMGEDFSTVGWPRCGEIDVMEMGAKAGIDAGTQSRYLNGAAHWGQSEVNHPNYARSFTAPQSLQDDFHLFTMVWDADYIRMYLDWDGVSTASPYYEILINNELAPYFRKPFFILLNLAVGGDYPEIWDINKVTALSERNDYTAEMFVDYIRVADQDGALIWEDQFNGDSLDKTKWNVEANDGGGGNNELQVYRAESVSVADGRLVLTTNRR